MESNPIKRTTEPTDASEQDRIFERSLSTLGLNIAAIGDSEAILAIMEANPSAGFSAGESGLVVDEIKEIRGRLLPVIEQAIQARKSAALYRHVERELQQTSQPSVDPS